MRCASESAAGSARRAGAVMIRTAEPADFEAIGRLTVAAYRADGQLRGYEAYAEHLADVAGRARHGTVLVAVDARGDIVGAVLFVVPGSSYALLAQPGEAEFRMLAVSPSAQRQGVGAALVGAERFALLAPVAERRPFPVADRARRVRGGDPGEVRSALRGHDARHEPRVRKEF